MSCLDSFKIRNLNFLIRPSEITEILHIIVDKCQTLSTNSSSSIIFLGTRRENSLIIFKDIMLMSLE